MSKPPLGRGLSGVSGGNEYGLGSYNGMGSGMGGGGIGYGGFSSGSGNNNGDFKYGRY